MVPSHMLWRPECAYEGDLERERTRMKEQTGERIVKGHDSPSYCFPSPSYLGLLRRQHCSGWRGRVFPRIDSRPVA